MPGKITSPAIRNLVFERADHRCEYCLTPVACSVQPFAVEHIMPRIKGGSDDPSNLACSCGGCNGHKYNKTTASDPALLKPALLYNPRKHRWKKHFTWSDDFQRIIGVSAIGRATVETLHLNRPGVIKIRKLLIGSGEHPPISH